MLDQNLYEVYLEVDGKFLYDLFLWIISLVIIFHVIFLLYKFRS